MNSISVYDESGALGGGIDLFASDELKRVSVLNKAGKFVIELSASDVFGNRLTRRLQRWKTSLRIRQGG